MPRTFGYRFYLSINPSPKLPPFYSFSKSNFSPTNSSLNIHNLPAIPSSTANGAGSAIWQSAI